MHSIARLVCLGTALCLLAPAYAGQENAIPTCYSEKLPSASASVDTEIFIVIDQTTPLPLDLKQSVADNLKPFLRPNSSFSVLTFSAYLQGHYTQVLVSGKLDPSMDNARRNDTPKPLLSRFDQCMSAQPRIAAQLAGSALRSAFDGTSGEIAKSDVIASIKAISSRVKSSTAKNRIVLLVSDMLENSSISSFYADKGQSVRKIDPEKEMKLVSQHQLLADFGGAKIYVIGAGLLSDDASKAKRYRDPQTMQTLSLFWQTYFAKSNSRLVEFGQPALLNPIAASLD